MTHRNIWALILSLITLSCSGPPIESEDMRHELTLEGDSIIQQDPLYLRARGQEKPTNIVQPIPPRQGPWTGNGQLGTTQPFLPNENNRQTILKLDEWGMPEVWSIMLGIEFDADAVDPTTRLDVRALIAIGSGGTTQNVTVDWSNGTVICAPMNAVDVVAVYNGDVVDLDDARLRLTVTLGQGCVDGVGPTLTEEFTLGASPDTSAIIRIPNFAKKVSVLPRSILGQTPYQSGVNLAFYDIGQTNVVGAMNGANFAVMASEGIPIPSRARYVQMINNSVADVVAGVLIFHLDL